MENIREFIFENKPTASCHASTVLPLADGRVVAAWFAGTKESADDVDILTSVRGENGWSEPVRVSADVKVPHWNPVLFEREDGKIILFSRSARRYRCGKHIFRSPITESIGLSPPSSCPKTSAEAEDPSRISR